MKILEKWTIIAVKEYLQRHEEPDAELLEAWKEDSRAGVQKEMQRYVKRQKQKQEKYEDFCRRLSFEQDYWDRGFEAVAGVDEVGRGPLAGPVTTAAVVLPKDVSLVEVNDSKMLSAKKREELEIKIKEVAVAWSVVHIEADEIDRLNIYQATKKAMRTAVADLKPAPDALLVDAMTLPLHIEQQSLVQGDSRSVSIAAASILAKVERDRYMQYYHTLYPDYDFASNKGYGTQNHLDGLNRLGGCAIHRYSFQPVSGYRRS
ncbi:ribonuclease HII [Marinococcus luteus]|uniref:ribonuclease HII n=1 Tax=Marinococcus luteus TaxID=1122204 RepID=UPI002ACD8F0D|nr:ribonuclease HII [Marinococcus luteus]